MKIFHKSHKRLTLIFIVLVVITGSILTYLSISNIKNLRELTKKEVIDEEEKIIYDIAENFQHYLNQIAENIIPGTLIDIIEFKIQLKKLDVDPFISQTFILDSVGNFIKPYFIRINTNNGLSSNLFLENYALGEMNEYQRLNYSRAEQYYLASLSSSTNISDSTKVFNALARMFLKKSDYEMSIKYYKVILDNYYKVVDDNNIPYVNYVIPQLLSVSNPAHITSIYNELHDLLKLLLEDKIPINSSTSGILKQITDWYIENDYALDENYKDYIDLINPIKEQLSFIKSRGPYITEFMRSSSSNNQTLINGFNPFLINTDSINALILIMNGNDNIHNIGVELATESLIKKLIDDRLSQGAKFDYKVEYVLEEPVIKKTNDDLNTYLRLSSFTPNQYLLIEMQDNKLISSYLLKLTGVYTITLLLLAFGLTLGVIVVIRDISRERTLSQLQTNFVSSISHELKTPLTSIHLFTESILLNRVKNNKTKKEYLNIILKETSRLKRLINNLLDFSKAEQGNLKLNFIETNISELVHSAIDDLDYWIKEKGFIINKKIENDLFANVDPDSLQQAIINLMSNAMRYSGKVKEIYIRVRKVKNYIYLETEDKGIGIPEDKIDLIFTKFYQLDDNKILTGKGSGLGLTVTKEIIKAHGGKIVVKSKVNVGSTFTIILDIAANK
jgi:signal transduction histidine kinase